MDTLKTLHMNGGNGENSYAKNSIVQRKIISQTKPALEEAITNMLVDKIPKSIGVADLGCSSGPNALLVISEIIDTILARCQEKGAPTPEFRVSLNDLPCNDFNCIFESLPEFYTNLKEERKVEFERCFVSAMPGSFYGRLFPEKSLHCVHSSSSLHWLSKAPASLDGSSRRDDAVVNKGNVYISKSSPRGVADAYLAQFEDDFSTFLKVRSEEMVDGGCMILSLMGRKSTDPTSDDACSQWELLARAMMSMASEGLIEEDKVDSFNAPFYTPCAEEVMKVVEDQGSFSVDRVEVFLMDTSGGGGGGGGGSGRPTYVVVKTVRATVESMLQSHLGADDNTMNIMFKYEMLVDDYFSNHNTKFTNLVFSLHVKEHSDLTTDSSRTINSQKDEGSRLEMTIGRV